MKQKASTEVERRIIARDWQFLPGNVYCTLGVRREIPAGESMLSLWRHLVGDWGDVDQHDWEQNDLALKQGGRILSAYHLGADGRLWVITEADRSGTTLLLPEEY